MIGTRILSVSYFSSLGSLYNSGEERDVAVRSKWTEKKEERARFLMMRIPHRLALLGAGSPLPVRDRVLDPDHDAGKADLWFP